MEGHFQARKGPPAEGHLGLRAARLPGRPDMPLQPIPPSLAPMAGSDQAKLLITRKSGPSEGVFSSLKGPFSGLKTAV